MSQRLSTSASIQSAKAIATPRPAPLAASSRGAGVTAARPGHEKPPRPSVSKRFHRVLHKPQPNPSITYDIVKNYSSTLDTITLETSDGTAMHNMPKVSKHIKGFNPKSKSLPIRVIEYEGLSRLGRHELTWVAEYAKNN